MRFFTVCVVFVLLDTDLSMAQAVSEKTDSIASYEIVDGDTVYIVQIPEISLFMPRQFAKRSEERQYWRLVYNVKKVYPYAKLAGDKLYELNEKYLTLKTEREKKSYSKQVEKELIAEFEGELRKLTITQGRILLRLVDRETGNTTYEIVKEFRGSFSAFFWQTVARVFGSNLKTQYDPSSGEDAIIEQIIMQIEDGMI